MSTPGTKEKSQPGVSIMICCYNGSTRLPETLAHLSRQKVDRGIPWEVMIVDNASTDDTAQRARELWPESAPAPLRIVAEPRKGKTYACLRGLDQARYEFLGIIDDDNWAAEDWVETAYRAMLAHPDVAVMGSSSSPAFEAPPPGWFHKVELMYAITPKLWKAGDFTREPGAVWGAGMVVRRSAWLGVRELNSPDLVSGRLKNSLAAGEDNELCYQLRLAGWKLWYEPRLHFQHFLPQGRLKWEYARRLFYGGGEASAMLHPYQACLDQMDAARASSYTSGWFRALCIAVRDLVRHPGVLLRALLLGNEGNHAVLAVAGACGRISMLVKLRSVYKSNLLQVRKFAERVQGQAGKMRQAGKTAGAAELSAR